MTHATVEPSLAIDEELLLAHYEHLAFELRRLDWKARGPRFPRPGLAELDLIPAQGAPDRPSAERRYREQLSKRRADRARRRAVTKEVRLRPATSEWDTQAKLRQCRRFLERGFRVQVTVLFRGRERLHPDLGAALLRRIADELAPLARAEGSLELRGYRMLLRLTPAS